MKRNLYSQTARKARRRATGFAWAPIVFIIAVVVVSAAIHLTGRWTGHCEDRWVGKLDCDLVGIVLVVAIGASLFALIIIGWWRLTGLDGLKRIFETSWPGLDGGDVDTVGPVESVVRATAWIVTILVSLFVVAAAVMAAYDHRRFRNADPPRPQSTAQPAVPAAGLTVTPERAVRHEPARSATGAGPEARP